MSTQAAEGASAARVARDAGLLDPRQVAATAAALARWGPTLATTYAAAAVRRPRQAAIVDHRGSLSFAGLERRSTALAKGLRSSGLAARDQLGVLCHNHRDFVEATVAAAKATLTPVYLNTGFAAPQLADVLEREQVAGLVCDSALLPVVEACGFDGVTIVADGDGDPTMHAIRRLGRRSLRPLVARPAMPVLLTSGTTGTPKGARRGNRVDLGAALGMLDRIPYRVGDVFVIAPPLFHAWGLAELAIAATLGSTVVVAPRFDPGHTIEQIAEHQATVLAVVPIMLQRILAHGALDDADTTSLRIVASSGSALAASVASEWLDRVDENLYNLYGSTEVGQATLASPADLRSAPGTAGRVLPGSTVRIVDVDGLEADEGAVGRIVVGNDAQFEGYTGGGTKAVVGGLMDSGDVGYFDSDGLLFVTGRADDMIVSGGENVFPREVEDLLLSHAGIADAAVVAVDDTEFGQRLAAYVVRVPGNEIDGDGVKALIAGDLARHKVPRDVEFVDELPRTSTGKLLRRHLVDGGADRRD